MQRFEPFVSGFPFTRTNPPVKDFQFSFLFGRDDSDTDT
jgi:hypothetical protein